jgi:hypothetical protein
MTTPSIRRIQSINEEQCQSWVRNEGRINPITRARINPNLTSETSMNVVISKKCHENFGITRPGNPYRIPNRNSPQNERTSPQNERNSPQNERNSPQNERNSPQNERNSPQNERNSPQNVRTERNSPQNVRTERTSPQNERTDLNTTQISPSNLRRQTNTVYRNDKGDIKIDKHTDFTMYQLDKWWNHGVMAKNQKIHLKNPNNHRTIKENSAMYNRLLQSADTVCLIPVNLSFAYDNGYISKESYEILKSIRKEIDEDNWTYDDMVNYFRLPEVGYYNKEVRKQKYRQYIATFNLRERLKNLTQDVLEVLGSVEKNSVSSKSIETNEEINTFCLDKFVNIHDQFKKFKNKMIRTCNDNNKCSALSDNEIKKLLNTFNNDIQIVNFNVINYPSIISLFAKHLMHKDSNVLNNSDMVVVNFELDVYGNLKHSDGSDMGGLSNQMITNISNELFDMKIFIKPQNSTKYFLNPEFKLSDEHKSILQIIINSGNILSALKDHFNEMIQTEKIYDKFYKFIGGLMSFFLMNSFKLPHHLSSFMLNCMKYKQNKIKDHEHVLYVLNDFPDISNSVLNIMKTNPDDIETYDIEYNDLYKIQYNKENGDRVTSENVEKYFIDFAKHLNMHNTIPVSENRNLDIDISQYYKQFSEGFNNNLRKLFQQKNISYVTIDKMLTREEINDKILEELSDNIFRNISFTRDHNAIDIDEYNDKGRNYAEKYQKYIDNILLNKNTGFSEEEHKKFVQKMLEFWTGIDFYKPETNYKLLIVMNNTAGYPVSHTCFSRVDVPLYETEEQFFEKLKFAVENSHNKFTIAGGKKKKRVVRK